MRYRHKKQTGGAGQFGEVAIRVYPSERGTGFQFLDKIVLYDLETDTSDYLPYA